MARLPTINYMILDSKIEAIVRQLARTYGRVVYPWQVVAQLDTYRCEQTLRRDMMRLARNGRLARVSHRGGYVPVSRRASMNHN